MKNIFTLSAGFLLASTGALPVKAAPTSSVKIYLIALDDGGKLGKKIGCGDSLVPVKMAVPPTSAPLTAALQKLLSTPPTYALNPTLKNFWKGNHLKLKSVSVKNGLATIRFTGQVYVAGVCDMPRITSQVEAVVRQFPTVKRVNVFVGNETLENAIS